METISDERIDEIIDWIEQYASSKEASCIMGSCMSRLNNLRSYAESERFTAEEEIKLINGILGDGDLSSDDYDGDKNESENGCELSLTENIKRDMGKGMRMKQLRRKYSDILIDQIIADGVIVKKSGKYVVAE